ncbi:MAG: LacI family DNA-binding transcriptional regulator [Rhodobacteraceae bacterium]|nr:LacI family DNA-binding transcriptional regulator [Paracoccaceae bacterium]
MGKPTISDLARRAGVSPTTVSHAFSGRRHVDPETRERILGIAREMNYHPSSVARGLRSGRTGMIALASSMPFAIAAGPSRLGFLMEIAASAAMSALTRDIALCLIPPHPAATGQSEIAVDGVILVEPGRDDPLVAHFEARQTPLVSVGTVPGRPDIPAVDLRSRATATMLLDHLRDRGSRRVATVIGGSTRTSQTETDEAYHAFAIRSGTEPILIALDEEGGEELAYRRSLDLLGDHPEIDGLYLSIDAFASGAVRAARDLGRAIPGNLRIATRYDGLRAKLSEPPLTAVDLHLPEIADAAVELLRRRIEGGGGQTEAALPMLVPRASTN